ncbi:MAG: branched-chain amino acid ABC transporter permease [Alphaproteobacteria bacterium]|nr:branched-chain amino acid ABC transporter permease [Alphaproteobacteria bacterium]
MSLLLDFLNNYLVNGIVLGCVYALGAIGITMLFGILRLSHFAHGDMMTLGAYLALALVWASGQPVWLTIPIAMLLTALAAVLIDRLCYRPLRHVPTIVMVIASFGVALMIRSAIQVVFGVQIQSYARGFQRPILLWDSIRILPRHLWIIAATAGLVLALQLILTHAKLGKAMRAMSDNPALARISGIPVDRVVVATWAIGGALAAAGGIFLALDTQISTGLGWDLILPMFAAAVLGGIGQPIGAVFGALVIGVAEELATYPWIGGKPVLSPAYKSAVSFTILVVMLIVRPTGLLKGKVF